MPFYGSSEHKLDAKGRLILPSRLRSDFEGGAFLTHGEDGCLTLWTPARFEEELQRLTAKAAETAVDRQRARLFASGTAEIKLDTQGRVPIPPRLRSYAKVDLGGDVIVVGNIDKVEIWAPVVWESNVEQVAELSMLGGE